LARLPGWLAVSYVIALCFSGKELACSAQAVPQRTQINGKGTSQSTPLSDPLKHFLGDFTTRDQANTFCFVCKKENGQPISLSDYEVTTEQHELGVIAGRQVLEIHTTFTAKPGWTMHSVTGDSLPPASEMPEIVWKTIVIEDDQKLYRELYSVQGSGDYVQPLTWSAIYKLDGEDVLATNDPMTGNGGYCTDGYWRLSASGTQPIDFSVVDRAMTKATPKGSSLTQTRCWALDISAETIDSPAQKPNVCHACGYTARIAAHFHLKGSLAIPDKVDVKPMDDND
jgi:hypothetical protein